MIVTPLTPSSTNAPAGRSDASLESTAMQVAPDLAPSGLGDLPQEDDEETEDGTNDEIVPHGCVEQVQNAQLRAGIYQWLASVADRELEGAGDAPLKPTLLDATILRIPELPCGADYKNPNGIPTPSAAPRAWGVMTPRSPKRSRDHVEDDDKLMILRLAKRIRRGIRPGGTEKWRSGWRRNGGSFPSRRRERSRRSA